MKTRSFLKLLGASLICPANLAVAQGTRPIRLVVPLPSGTSADVGARTLMTRLGDIRGQAAVIENKPGGNGIIAAQDVMRSAPDGNTMLFASNAILAANQAFVKNLPYDPRRDFTPIAGVFLTNHVFLVAANSPIRTFEDLIEHARKNPGQVTFGYSTNAVLLQVVTLNKLAGIQMLPVPYKGTPAALRDVIGGTLTATTSDPSAAVAQVKGGRMRALAVSCLKRNPVTPDWPAISETFPGYDFATWNSLVGPAGMPRDLVLTLAKATAEAQENKGVIEKFESDGKTMMVMGPDELKAFIDSEIVKWVARARDANIRPE